MTPTLRALRRRLNAQAYDLVNEELARIDEENEQLRTALARAEEAADFWQQQAMGAYNAQADETGGVVGITQSGQLVVVPAQGVHA